jgi:hypothetical protein
MADGEPGLPSLDVVLDAVEAQREKQLGHFESLDNKAGVLLGFSGAIAAIARDVRPIVGRLGVAAAVVAAFAAMWSFRPRGFPVLDARRLRPYLRGEPEFTKLRLLDTELVMIEQAEALIARKARWLSAALASLVVSVMLLGVGTLVS